MAAVNTVDVNTNISASDPINHAAVVVPNDGADLTNVTTAIYVGTAGNLQVTTLGGETVQFTNVQPEFGPPILAHWGLLRAGAEAGVRCVADLFSGTTY
jgi:hypothetical protein